MANPEANLGTNKQRRRKATRLGGHNRKSKLAAERLKAEEELSKDKIY